MNKLFSQVAEISVSYRPAISDKPIVITALDAYNIFIDFFPIHTIGLQETFLVMYMNHAGRVLGVYPVSIGGITGTIVDVKLILSVGLKIVASSMMLCHNHPSGRLKPSHQDIQVTNKIKLAASFVDIKLLDHLIISPIEKDYFSLANEGLI
jgi:DNA repair protein RadC